MLSILADIIQHHLNVDPEKKLVSREEEFLLLNETK